MNLKNVKDLGIYPNPNICGASSSFLGLLDYLSNHSHTLETRLINLGGSPSVKSIGKTLTSWGFSEQYMSHPALSIISGLLRLLPVKNISTLSSPFYQYISHKQQYTSSSSPNYIDLFCGAGGLSLGLEQAGFQHLFSIDNDPWSIFTYRFNRPWVSPDSAICADINSFTPNSKDYFGIDLLSAGIPCQSFSLANQQRQKNDPRDFLYLKYLNCVENWKPKVALIENVSGFSKVNDDIIKSLTSLKYSVKSIVVDTSKMGIPQYRRRLIYVAARNWGNKTGENVSSSIIEDIKSMMNSTKIPLSDALENLPALQPSKVKNKPNYESSEIGYGATFNTCCFNSTSNYLKILNYKHPPLVIFNHKARYNNDRDIKIFNTLKPGEDSTAESIKTIMPYKRRASIFKDKYFKLNSNKPCRTITSHMRYDCNSYIHPTQPRGLTAREAARIQGFPDNYVFCGTFQRTYQQVGNAVPPLVAKKIGSAILRHF